MCVVLSPCTPDWDVILRSSCTVILSSDYRLNVFWIGSLWLLKKVGNEKKSLWDTEGAHPTERSIHLWCQRWEWFHIRNNHVPVVSKNISVERLAPVVTWNFWNYYFDHTELDKAMHKLLKVKYFNLGFWGWRYWRCPEFLSRYSDFRGCYRWHIWQTVWNFPLPWSD